MIDIQQLKQISIRAYLAERSLLPVKDNPRYGFYLSPLREERTPSFKVDYSQNLWYDFGLGEGGSIIDLVMRMERCEAGKAIRLMEQRISGMSSFSFHRKSNPASPHRESAITIEEVRPLENPALLAYLTERGIDLTTAKIHCSEVHYRVAYKSYFAVGFRNDAGGWELRNRYFKGCTSKAPTTRGGDYPTCLVFEGFMDYLSFLTLKRNPTPLHNIAVLNSVTNLAKASV